MQCFPNMYFNILGGGNNIWQKPKKANITKNLKIITVMTTLAVAAIISNECKIVAVIAIVPASAMVEVLLSFRKYTEII